MMLSIKWQIRTHTHTKKARSRASFDDEPATDRKGGGSAPVYVLTNGRTQKIHTHLSPNFP
jgi:hypothetical protein